MKTDLIHKNEIQIAPVGDYFHLPARKLYLVYAPLSAATFIGTDKDIEMLETAFFHQEQGLSIDEQMQETIAALTDYSNVNPQKNVVSHPSLYTRLSILPNFICNFSCSYCYSAKGRSNKALDQESARVMLDYFIDKNRVDEKKLDLFISGGGEPLMSWDIVRYIITYGNERASLQGMDLYISLMTNGSKVTAPIIDTLKKYNVHTGVSFEILPDVQNKQRAQYNSVSENIRQMINAGVVPAVSAVITPENVKRMTEMVYEIVHRFPGIKHLNFDPAMATGFFTDTENPDEFYAHFISCFLQAKSIAAEHGITLDCNVIRKFEDLFPRYCQGKLCLTPENKISICHSISSPHENGYKEVIYGEIKDNKVNLDPEKFRFLTDSKNYLLEECHTCLAKWHCGGGCLMYKCNYSRSQFASVCRFTQKFIKELILQRLDNQYKENYNTSLKEYIAHAID